eukprot:COSAG05_NODE_24_length_31553_cov_12.138647_24_plen_133_part_00
MLEEGSAQDVATDAANDATVTAEQTHRTAAMVATKKAADAKKPTAIKKPAAATRPHTTVDGHEGGNGGNRKRQSQTTAENDEGDDSAHTDRTGHAPRPQPTQQPENKTATHRPLRCQSPGRGLTALLDAGHC